MLKTLLLSILLIPATAMVQAAPQAKKETAHKMPDHQFGSCCKELSAAMKVENSFFRIESNGVLYLTVGYVKTPQGQGYFDQAVLFCPFCGKLLQTKAEIKARSKA